MTNPFELLEARLTSIENLLLDLKHKPQQVSQADAPDQLMTVHETAELLKVKAETVYCNASKGLLPVMKQGNRLYFSRAELMEYVKAGRKLTLAETAAQANAYVQGKKKGGSHE
jgi:excisionase family DNA binding protein